MGMSDLERRLRDLNEQLKRYPEYKPVCEYLDDVINDFENNRKEGNIIVDPDLQAFGYCMMELVEHILDYMRRKSSETV